MEPKSNTKYWEGSVDSSMHVLVKSSRTGWRVRPQLTPEEDFGKIETSG